MQVVVIATPGSEVITVTGPDAESVAEAIRVACGGQIFATHMISEPRREYQPPPADSAARRELVARWAAAHGGRKVLATRARVTESAIRAWVRGELPDKSAKSYRIWHVLSS